MAKIDKIRLDVFLVENHYFESREKARIAIMEGKIYVNSQKEDKCGTLIKTDSNVEYRGEQLKYVSRGGLKLEKAMHSFKISFKDKVCVDIGSSTGGFTDLMLQNGASLVYAVDSGTNQLDYSLRTNDKVRVLENTNARYLTKENIENLDVDIITIDVSFISLTKIIPIAYKLLKDDGELIMLIKPQFEAGREKVEKNGVIRDSKVHEEVITKIVSFCENEKFNVVGLEYSPIKGPAGNIEFLLYVKKSNEISSFDNSLINKLVQKSHTEL